MDDFRTDQQKAEDVKKWVAQNGAYLVVGLILGLGILFGVNSWRNYQTANAEQASVVFENVFRAVSEGRVSEAEEYVGELAGSYAGTPYLDQARLLMARLHMDRNEFDEAADYLDRVIQNAGRSEIGNVARIRYARVRHHQRRYDDALEALEPIDEKSAFAARFHEVRGDVLLSRGDSAQAREAYQAALAADTAGLIDRGYVQNKLDRIDSVGSEPLVDAPDAPAESDG